MATFFPQAKIVEKFENCKKNIETLNHLKPSSVHRCDHTMYEYDPLSGPGNHEHTLNPTTAFV